MNARLTPLLTMATAALLAVPAAAQDYPAKPITVEDGVKHLHCIQMELGEPDRSGRRRPVPVDGSQVRALVLNVGDLLAYY